MSLDVYLHNGVTAKHGGSGIFVRENGQTMEISREEWDTKFPDREPVILTRDREDDTVYSANITHNLNKMAEEAGIYRHLWRPDELGITKACQLIIPLMEGLRQMKADPERFRKHNAANGWGIYEQFVPWIERYLAACQQYPDADVEVSR